MALNVIAEIKISSLPDGTTKVSVKGIKGSSCKAMTKSIEDAFGDAESDTLTSEYGGRAPSVEATHLATH